MASLRGLLVLEPMLTLGFCSTGERLPVALQGGRGREGGREGEGGRENEIVT